MKPFILLAEFNPYRLHAWRSAAEMEGFEVVATRDGDEAVRQLETREAPALVIAGLSLPRADGFEVLRALRKRFGPDEVPALACSPFRRLCLGASALRDSLGLADVLDARLDPEETAAAIRRAVSRTAPAHHPEDPSRRSSSERRRETTRMNRIERLGVDRELPHDSTLQRLVEEVAQALGAPACLVSIVLQDRTSFLAHTGLDRLLAAEPRAGRDWPFCRFVTEGGQELVVPEATTNPVFAGNRLVKDGHVRGYAGAPVISPTGETLGSLAVASTERLNILAAEMDTLGAFARRVAGELEIREVAKRSAEDADRFGSALGADGGPATLMATLAAARTALESLESGVVLMDAQRRVTYVNAAAAEMLDGTPSHLQEMTREQLVSHVCALVENSDDFLRRIRITASGPHVSRGEFAFARPRPRTIRWVSRPVMLPSGIGQLALLSDISAEVELSELRRRFSCVDPLTNLPNRRAGLDALEREIGRAARTGEPLCLALFDVEGLRFVNRDHGSDAGDQLLKRTAETLARMAREGDTVIRWSGEDFLVILPACRAEEGLAVAERTAQHLESPELEEAPGISLSAGVVEWRPGETAESAIYRAEEQLQGAKSAGGESVA
ncbi:MAG: diguanylate cyclase [Planctomycetota bacterium]